MRFAVLFFALVACDSPSVAFRNAVTVGATVDGSQFSIHSKGGKVEVYRISREWRPARKIVHARAHRAIEQATGCRVVSGTLNGDQSIIRADIDCG